VLAAATNMEVAPTLDERLPAHCAPADTCRGEARSPIGRTPFGPTGEEPRTCEERKTRSQGKAVAERQRIDLKRKAQSAQRPESYSGSQQSAGRSQNAEATLMPPFSWLPSLVSPLPLCGLCGLRGDICGGGKA
jgi:hypothetical protein